MAKKVSATDKTRSKGNKVKKTSAQKPGARAAKSAKKVATTHKFEWRGVTARVRHTPNYLSKGWSHIELIVLTPKGAPLPITQTGYLSHFLGAELLARSGGPVRFFLDWIEREAKSKSWASAEFKWKQGDLFA